MISYQEYEIIGDKPLFESIEDLKLMCKGASKEEISLYISICTEEQNYEGLKFLKTLKHE